jgi:hypothetical protein
MAASKLKVRRQGLTGQQQQFQLPGSSGAVALTIESHNATATVNDGVVIHTRQQDG